MPAARDAVVAQSLPSGDHIDGFSGKKHAFCSGASTPMYTTGAFTLEQASLLVATAVPTGLLDIVVRYDRDRTDDHPVIEMAARVPGGTKGDDLHYFAASPAERRASATASGIPYVDARQAYDATPNRGRVKLDEDGGFLIRMPQPNAFYAGLGTHYVPPCVHFWYDDKKAAGLRRHAVVQAGNGIPFRSLRYPDLSTWPRKDATFYAKAFVEPRTQEQILRDSAFPRDTMEMPPNFWGTRPPV